MQKQYFSSQDLVNFISKISQAKNFEELYEIGKELVNYEGNGYKKVAVTAYKIKKQEIVQAMLQENNLFSNLYFLIKMSDNDTLKQVGKLLYNLKQFLPKAEISYLFDIYEAKKAKIEKETEAEIEDISKEEIM
ncbi:hypothetical protein [Caldisericum sp.]|uniref:hypothetical protein n=1 Tax=Caldisericum sp. TaxID=2499687 RepID=UPI003D0CBF69